MRNTTSRAVRITCIALASALCVPAFAAPSGEAFVRLPSGSTAAKDDHKNQIEILSWSWGATQAGAGASGNTTMKGSKIGQNAKDGAKGGNVEFEWKVEEGESAPPAPGGVKVAAGDVDGDGRADVVSPRDASSGLPTGKRQHKPMTITMPLDKGSVIFKLKSAWAGCRVGTRYPALELGDGAKTYKLKDAIVTGCASSGGDRPTETLSLNYSKIEY